MDLDALDELDPVEVADPSTEERELAVVVYGATGFIGGLVVEKLDELLSKPGAPAVKWALGGRNKERVRAIARKCKTTPDIVQAADPVEISAMANKARVILSTAGASDGSGEDLIRECVNQVTHYIDLSTDHLWVASMINKFHAKAKEKGAMLVHCAGAACAVDDLLCYTLAKQLGPLKQYRGYFTQRGGVSGGVVDSEIAVCSSMDQEKLRQLKTPFSLGGAPAEGTGGDKLEVDVERDPVFSSLWLTCTYSSLCRSRFVQRTSSLFADGSQGVPYGKSLKVAIREWSTDKRGALQRQQEAGIPADADGAAAVVERWSFLRSTGVAPASRKGPTKEERSKGALKVLGVAEGENGKWAYATFTSGDALEVTVAAAIAGALVLVRELAEVKPRERGGCITPAFAFHGSSWAETLQAEGPAISLTVNDGQPPEASFCDDSVGKPFYVLASPLTTSPWRMPALDGPEKAVTAWPPWEPVSESRWSTHPRAGLGAKPENMGEFKKVVNESATGEFWGIEFPFSPTQLKEMGPKWLTKAMRTAGTLPSDNEITEFTRFIVKSWAVEKSDDPDDADFGGAGCKVLLQVKYKKDPGELRENLFVKMPHEFNGKNERFKNSMSSHQDWGEVMFYNTLGGRLPVRTPRGYFCDMSRKTTNFCMVLEAVPYGDSWDRDYGANDILPNPAKYRDWVIPRATCADMYFAHARTQARLYGWYRNTCMPLFSAKTDQVDKCFRDENDLFGRAAVFNKVGPMSKEERDKWFLESLSDPVMAGFVYSAGNPPNVANGYVELAENFVAKTARHTFPREWSTKTYLDRWFKESKEMCKYCAEMGWYSLMMPEWWSLCHPNAMIDNAFYWRDEAGKMQAGLLDWGGTGHMPISLAVAGCWIAAEVELMDEYEDALIQCFLDEYEKITGLKLEYDEFKLHLKLAFTQIHVGNCASVRWCTSIVPKEDWKDVIDRFDGRIDDGFMMRCYYVQTELFLGMWKKRSPYPYFQEWMKRTGVPKK